MNKIYNVFCYLIIITLLVGCNSTANVDTEPIPAISDKYISSIYPTTPVKVIIPYSEGGGTDKVARSLIDAASDSFPMGISVENITGEGGATGMREGANATADGSVITTITVELTTLPHSNSSSGIAFDQFKPILMVNSAYSAITVKADSPWNTLKEFIDYSKTNQIKVGNSGVGSIWHLASAGLAKAGNTEFIDVPFDGGGAEAITALEKNEIDAVAVSYAEVASQVETGSLKVLAVLAPERLEEAPEIPTAQEFGFNAVIGTWRGFAVPKDTPDEITDELYYILSKAVGTMDFVEFMTNTNNTIEILNSQDFYSRLESDNEQFKQLISTLGL